MMELFSPQQATILRIIGKRKMTITEIAGALYADHPPLNANGSVVSAIKQINRKCNYHKLPWIINGMGLGRGGKTVWKDSSPS